MRLALIRGLTALIETVVVGGGLGGGGGIGSKERPEIASVISALGQVFVGGGGVDWVGVFAGSGARRVGLPTYAFQRRRYWLGRVGVVGGCGMVWVSVGPSMRCWVRWLSSPIRVGWC